MGLSDAKVNDNQAGLESGIGSVLAALSGINVISGPGMLDFESCQSLEKLVIDNEICGMALRLVRGIAQRNDPIATDLFQGFTADTQFLSMPHTRKWYREEHIFPGIIDRDTYDYWVSLGKKNSSERAKDKVEELLQEDKPSTLNDDAQTGLQNIMIADAKANGINKLPE